MKARVKSTGEIVEVAYSHTSGDGVKYYGIDKSVYMMMEDELDFDFSYSPDYWEWLKHQYAGMAMQQLVHLVNVGYEYVYEETAIIAMNFATALVEKLKEED